MTAQDRFLAPIHTELTDRFVRGAAELERTANGLTPHRLPAWVREQYPDPQLLMTEVQPAGVRVLFRTSASVVALDVLPTKTVYVGAPGRPDGVYDLWIDGRLEAQSSVSGGNELLIDLQAGTTSWRDGAAGTALFTGLGGLEKDVEIWLPWNERTELVRLRTDAAVAAPVASARPVWVHHGSSISHGSNAASPSGTWPAVAARAAGFDLVNLGFGGSAMLDPFTARVIRDAPADRISVKIGINLVNADVMRRRAFVPAVHGFLDTIRDGHPTTPLTVVSPIYCPIHESVPGPSAPDPASFATGQVRFLAAGDPRQVAGGALTLQSIRADLEEIVRQRCSTDPALFLVDGLELYGSADHEVFPLADGLHPATQVHESMGRRFAARAFGAAATA
jgi:hypothetical protein